MKITKHAQSCFLVETGGARVLVDPGFFVFEKEGFKVQDFKDIDLIIITHEHRDHFDWERIQTIIDQSNPTILGTAAVIDIIKDKYPDLIAVTTPIGKKYTFKNISIEGVPSEHGPLPTGAEPPEVIGVILSDGKTSFYTPGDSVYLAPDIKADIIGVPICGHVVMDIETAKQETVRLKPKIAIPMHYDNLNFPVEPIDFTLAMEGTGIGVALLGYGKSVEV